MTTVRCDVCSQPLTSAARSALVFDYWKPAATRRGSPFIAHFDCFDDSGTYMIALNRIREWGDEDAPHAVRDSVQMWKAHLRDKDWWMSDIYTDLSRAWGFANALSGRNRSRGGRQQPSASLRSRVLERDAFRCRRCGATADDARLVLDHVVPVAKGGATTFDNLQSLCADCNSGKRDRLPHARDLEVTT